MEWINSLKDKFQCYDYFKEKLTSAGVDVGEFKEINYGIQFPIIIEGEKETIRIYQSKKKGLNCDFSQVKSSTNLNFIREVLEGNTVNISSGEMPKVKLGDSEGHKPLIGTDESGKGDFFGPLVIAGVYADVNTQKILRTLGVDDSKKLTDKKIASIAQDIKKLCKYSIVVIGNEKYNELYEKIGNLNKLLAWGHARVIENVLEQVECTDVLADQFGNPKLIEEALMERGQNVNLEQRPRAEENVVVAAASILARNAFVENMEDMKEKYGVELVKGASSRTIEVGREFANIYGKHRLREVAKVHFSTFEKIR